MGKLSTRDKEKPLILIGAIAAGLALNQVIGERSLAWMMHLVEAGVFVVIFAVMMPVELVDVGRSFRKVKPTALALGINFLFIPLFSWSIGWLFLREHPDFWAGIVLYTLTPCIGWYLIFIDIAKGDVPWGMALLPLNITLQILLLPVYLYVLVGRVIPVDLSTLARSIGLFLIAPFAMSYLVQRRIIARNGRDYFFGPVKRLMGAVKLWALVLVIVAMFASEGALQSTEFTQVGMLIVVLILFFVVLFLAALAIGRVTNLGYEDTVTMAFTTTARNSEAVIGVAVAAFPGHPLVYFAIILGPIVELPILIAFSRVLLTLKERLWQLPAEPVKGIY
jgi:ACR3 family arsenite efflux pump ArsB